MSKFSGGVSPSKSMDNYQGEDDHRTLTRAADIQQDPARMKGVSKHHRKQQKSMALVQRTMLNNGSRR